MHTTLFRRLYNTSTTLFRRLYNVHNVGTTSHERENDVVCVLGYIVRQKFPRKSKNSENPGTYSEMLELKQQKPDITGENAYKKST